MQKNLPSMRGLRLSLEMSDKHDLALQIHAILTSLSDRPAKYASELVWIMAEVDRLVKELEKHDPR